MEEIFKHYEAFYNMVLSTTIMSNSPTAEFEKDADKIIKFIGDAYKLEDALVEECKGIILGDLATLGLSTDQQAVYGMRSFGDSFSARDVLFDIKSDVLTKLQRLSETRNLEINPGWFDYSHYKTYQAEVRFAKILTTAAAGELIATRQVGVLQALGIGCDKDLAAATHRLTQCVVWGDIPSMYYLANVYRLAKDKARSKICYELAELAEKYLKSGYTVLPDDTALLYSEDAKRYYAYIATIKQDIIYAYNIFKLDFSFIEAITTPTLDHFKRMEYIDHYDKKEWKEVTNTSEKPVGKFGF